MNNQQIQKRIGELMAERNKFIERHNHWEANKLGEKIRGLRDQLGVIVCAKCNGDHLGGYDEPNSTFDTWCFDCEAPTTKKEVN